MIQIKHLDGTLVLELEIPEGASVHRELMGEHYMRMQFSLGEPVYLKLGDYVDTNFGRFELTSPYSPKYNTETDGYDYNLQLDAYYIKWKNKKCRYNPKNAASETSFRLTASISVHLEVILSSINAIGAKDSNFKYSGKDFIYTLKGFDSANVNTAKYKQYQNTDILSALNDLASIYDCEWWVEDNIIFFGRCENEGEPVVFEVNKNVESVSSSESKNEYATRVYAFGSTRNLPKDYRKDSSADITKNGIVQKRLMLPLADCPNGYLQDADVQDETSAVEAVVIDEDIYPRTKCKVSKVETYTAKAKDETTGEEVEQTFYRLTDGSGLKFSTDFILEGETLHILFQSGKMNGMDFECEYNDEKKYYEVVVNEDYGRPLPDTSLHPEVGDDFVLYNWDATKIDDAGLVEAAEKELKEAIQKKLDRKKVDPNTYTCKMFSYWYEANRKTSENAITHYAMGQKVSLVNASCFDAPRSSRIIGYDIKLDIEYDTPEYIVGEATVYSQAKDLQSQIDSITVNGLSYTGTPNSGNGGGGQRIYIITSEDSSVESDVNVYSSARTKKQFADKIHNDDIYSLWSFAQSTNRRGVQTHHYKNQGNEDNLFGKGFELIQKTDGNGNQKSRLEIDELFVRIKAFFASLEIREISYLGGNYAFSSAGSKIYHVEWLDGLGNVLPKLAGNISSVATFRCYFYSDDGTTATTNKWAVDDQIMCKTLNIDEGVHANTSNKYYWRRCTGIGKGVITDDDTNTEYQYVDISMSDCAINSDYPEDEDTIVQFGNWTNSARQGLIYLKVEGEDAPAIIEYSGVGANGNHFVLPNPTLQLSPNRNIIYGEFHSIVNGSDDKVGEGDTIDDQLRELIDALNDIKNQADQKFDIWFGVGVPLPNTDNPNATANYPASDWTTDALKALHAQDIFYDTDREPAADGGRAWRWIAYESGGTVHYRWDEITDADTLASLEQISDVASDGKLTGGAEKTRVFVDWQQAVDYYWQYKVRSEDHRVMNEWNAYHNAFVALGTLLNDSKTLTKDTNGEWITPSWLVDLSTTTEIPSAQDYRDAWNAYYAALATLIQKVSKVAQDEIDTITADGILSSVEKKQVRKEWEEVVRSYTRNLALAAIFDVSSSDYGTDSHGNDIVEQYSLAYEKLGNYLDGCSNPESTSEWTWTVGNIPKWLAYLTETGYVDGQGMGDDTEIVPATYRSYWVNYYDLENAVLNAISEIAKHAGDEALVKLEEIADDGVITPSEKNTILIQWLEIAKEFPLLVAQADAFISDASGATIVTSLTNAKNTYVTRFNTLANYLNNGDYTYTLNPVNIPLPLWIDAIHIANSEKLSMNQKAAYKTVWENYFSSRTTLQEVFAEASKKPGKDALGELDNLADDDILTPFEKLTVLREWDAITVEKTDLLSKAASAHVSTSDYVLRYNVLGNYLNDPVASDERDIATPFSGTPAALLTDGNTTIRGSQFKVNWSNFYNERTKLLSAISTSKVSYFVSVNVPTPPYHFGDIWMRLANSSDTQGKMYICVVDNETSTGRLADWADMSEITRDPFVILSKVANEAWEFMGGYIRERGYINIFVARTAPSGTIGDIFYNATNNTLYQYASYGWESISRATLLNLGSALYQILGIHTFRVYGSTVANPNQYDMCVRNIKFTDPLSKKTIEGNLNILAYTDGNWITLQDSTKAMIENYANQLNSYMFGSDNGYIKASGIVTKTNISELFAVVNDPDSGDIITKAYLQVYTDDFVDENGVRQIISGVRISADKIDLTGTDSISIGIKGIKTGLANTGIDIQQGTITLNAATTTIIGNLNLYDDNNNGITVYDKNDIARVNIQSDSIGDISQMANDTYNYQSAISSTSTTSFNNTATTDSVGTLAVNKTIDVDNINIMTYGSGSNQEPSKYPSTYSASLKIEILKGSTVVATKTVTIIRQTYSGQYKASEGFRYTVKTSGTYYVRYTISGITSTASSSPVYLNVRARIQTSDVVQTLIGADGFYSHTGANRLFWLNKDELQIRFGFGGFRLSMPTESSFQGLLDTIAGVYGSMPNVKPVWMPFHNIVPMFKPASYKNGSIINTGSKGKFFYKINPFNDRGICYVELPAMDDSGNFQESWILLPSSNQTYNGNNIELPIGYTVTIINGTSMTEEKNVYVSGNVSTLHGCKIIDANQNENYYCSLNGTQSRDTYIFVGSYADGSITGNVDFWIAMHDTQ